MLKPCPSCGASTAVEEWDLKRAACWIQCDDVECYVRGPVIRAPDGKALNEADFEDAARLWNALPRRDIE